MFTPINLGIVLLRWVLSCPCFLRPGSGRCAKGSMTGIWIHAVCFPSSLSYPRRYLGVMLMWCPKVIWAVWSLPVWVMVVVQNPSGYTVVHICLSLSSSLSSSCCLSPSLCLLNLSPIPTQFEDPLFAYVRLQACADTDWPDEPLQWGSKETECITEPGCPRRWLWCHHAGHSLWCEFGGHGMPDTDDRSKWASKWLTLQMSVVK